MRLRIFAPCAVLLLSIAGAPVAAAEQLDGSPAPQLAPEPVLSKLDPLTQARLSILDGRSRVIVQAVDAASVGPVALLIQQTGGVTGRVLPILDAIAADIPNSSLALLTNSSLVRRVALDRLVVGWLNRTSGTIGADAVRQALGYDGSGIGVAIIDSGITAWHDDLGDPSVPGTQRVDRFVDFVRGETAPYDDYGHGTHVAGIIGGNGHDSNGARAGIAPGVRFTVLKVLDGTGQGRISDVIAALGYVVEHRAELNIRIVNLSLGAGVFESYETDLLPQAAKRAYDAGIVVVASAGNAGRDREGRRQYGAITAPGNAPWVLTVGASSHMGTIDRADDTVARFSSRGPTAIDRDAKPDVVAPGVGIVSLSDPDSLFFRTRSTSLLEGSVATPYLPYLSLSGTSQAAPVVAGTVALMLQANPALTPNAVKAILQYTAEWHPEYDPLTQGAGFVDAASAVQLASYFGSTDGAPYPAADTWSRQLIWGNQRVQAGRLMPDANAWAADIVWGAATTSSGEPITWGIVEYATTTDDGDSSNQAETGCGATACQTMAWQYDIVDNVVWGPACNGADCEGQTWSVHDTTVVWGTSDGGETVVWGTSDGETVVWGTTDGETVVWGTADEEDVVWDRCCEEADPAPAV